MHLITLYAPEIGAHEVTFRWRVEPPTPLYRASQFSLRFPESVDIARVPEGIWATIAMICLHSQWPLLRPCQVRLPFKLRPGEAETWLRLMDSYVMTMEAYRSETRLEREIVIQDDGQLISYFSLPDTKRCATAFSGGKDSLLQVGLLTELTMKPLLVTTTSTLPPLEDHLTSRRRYILQEITRRREVTLVEVESDFRSNWGEGSGDGCPFGINEVTDTFLYVSAMLAVSVALGVPHLFLASEVEVNENVDLDGRVVQHPHFMYSVVTLSALEALLRPWGISCCSLTSPLHSFQVQELLWTRYADLRDLQYSCWRVKQGESMCNACSQCLRFAFSALAMGDDPALMGADLVKLLNETSEWAPQKPDGAAALLPKQISSGHLNAHVARAMTGTPENVVAAYIARVSPDQLLTPSGQSALTAYRELRRRALDYDAGPSPGYRARYDSFIDPLLREELNQVYAERFAPASEASYAGSLARSRALTNWIIEPLSTESAL